MSSVVHYGDNTQVLATLAAMGKRVQMCCTSPPYYSQRDYQVPATDWPAIDYAPMPGLPVIHIPAMSCPLGMEPTPEAFIGHLVHTFRLVHEVMADDGTCWINLGDSYNAAGRKGHGTRQGAKQGTNRASAAGADHVRPAAPGLKEKDLIGIPWRAAFALQADGWYLRQDCIWSKKSVMPESVTDRCTKSHEYMFLLAKSPKYFFDWFAIQEDGVIPAGAKGGKASAARVTSGANSRPAEYKVYNGKRRKRSVWNITPARFSKAHFATFPAALVEPPILAGTSEAGHCPKCGARWIRETQSVPVERHELPPEDPRYRPARYDSKYDDMLGKATGMRYTNTETVGWHATCACGVDPVPDIVLDPFGGSGTTAAVASRLNRDYCIIELNPAYSAFIDERITRKK